jgi:hypothetical protein
VLFLLAGWAYGKATGTIGDHRDLVKMMTGRWKPRLLPRPGLRRRAFRGDVRLVEPRA